MHKNLNFDKHLVVALKEYFTQKFKFVEHLLTLRPSKLYSSLFLYVNKFGEM